MRGIRVDEETLAEQVIARVGPAGDFLGEAHTFEFLRSDEFCPSHLLNRRAQSSGGRPASELAHEGVAQILSTHVSPVSPAQQADLRAIIAEHMARVS